MRTVITNIFILLGSFLFTASVGFAMSIDVNKARNVSVDFEVKSVAIGSPSVADFRVIDDNVIYVFAKKAGQTNLIIRGKNGEERIVPIEVNEFREHTEAINSILVSEGYRDVRVIDVGSALLVSGTVSSQEDIDNIKRLLNSQFDSTQAKYSLMIKKHQQIKIRVTVAEVSKNIAENLGIEWGHSRLSTGNGAFSVDSGIYGGYFRGFSFSQNLGVILNALVKNNLASILSTPSLTVTNGHEASFHGGGQIPIFQRSNDGTSVEWKDYGVKLRFMPVINPDQSISMDVNVESSQIGGYYKYENTELPMINIRTVKTSVSMNDGESFVLGGLIDNSQTQYVNKIPGISDIPVLGALFKSTGFTSGRSELVVFATVEYVKPTETQSISLPAARFSSPWEVFFDLNRTKSKLTDALIREADYVIE